MPAQPDATQQPAPTVAHRDRALWLIVGLALIGLVVLLWIGFRDLDTRSTPTGPQRHQLFIASDGLSFEAFSVAQQRGLFRRFKSAGRMIAPYPSMSHPSWTEIIGTERVFGARGNIRTVEARWFDLDAMRVMDDPRQVIARQAGPFNYMRAFDTYFDPLIEPLMYFPGRKLFDRELEETERDILDHYDGNRYAAYVSGSDAMAHTHKDELFGYLTRLDSMINRVIDSLEARKHPVDVWLVSDHGNVGPFAEGNTEQYLTPVSFDDAVKRAGLVRRDTGSVTDSNEVAIVTIALGSMVNAYFPDLSKRRAFADQALRETGVSLVTWLEVPRHSMRDSAQGLATEGAESDTGRYIVIRSPYAEAQLRWKHEGQAYQYLYTPVGGNPLGLPDTVWSTAAKPRWIADSAMRAISVTGDWPDGPYRLVQSAEKRIENAPDLIVNLRDSFVHAGDFGKVVRMVRTHGSLSARASFGIVASTGSSVPPYVRASEVMDVMHMNARDMLPQADNLHPGNARGVARRLSKRNGTISSGRTLQTVDAGFLRRARPVVQSIGYFGWSELRYLLALVRPANDSAPSGKESNSSKLQRASKLLGKVDVMQGLKQGVDTILALADSLDPSQLSDRLRKAEDYARSVPALAPLAQLRDVFSDGKKKTDDVAPGVAVGVRRAAMAAWTFPYFLDAAIEAPETDSIPEPRNIKLAGGWLSRERDRVSKAPSRLLDDRTIGSTLFGEVFAERKLWREVEPATVPMMYDPKLGDITVALVPGIYGELFDQEIWQRGMAAVRERLGVRTVNIAVDGRCGSAVNAPVILKNLRDDTRRRLERGYARPRYLLVGYSKGGTDAIDALLLDSAFAREQVAALVTVATPHMGSLVAERAALPAALVRAGSATPAPAACDSVGAAESLFPAVRAAFWSAQSARVASSTKLFSISLTSSMHDAHPWMKVAKRIGQFTEENDGVVALSASRFPRSVPAVDLGRVNGDHIAGRNASSFPQEAFLEAVVVTMGELGVLDSSNDQRWRSAQQNWMSQHAQDNARNTVPSFARGLRTPSPLPGGSTGWKPDATFRTYDAGSLAEVEIGAMTPDRFAGGVVFQCDQQDMLAFRREYEFLYDAGNGGQEGDAHNGFALMSDKGSGTGRVCHLATRQTAIKMTTVAYRFRPADFAQLDVHLRVNKNVKGVDPSTRQRGVNDAAFKLWFVLRDMRVGASKATRLFGYTWAATDADNKVPENGSVVEANSSRRNLVVTTLPEAWLIHVGGPSADGAWHHIQRDLFADIQRVYPGVPTDSLQVVGVTIQTDSDASHGETEVLLDAITIRPRAKGVR